MPPSKGGETDMLPIDSSVISHVDYDDIRQEMRIVFTSNSIYTYVGVTPDLYKEFLAAESKGIFFNTRIRDKYRFVKRYYLKLNSQTSDALEMNL